MSVSAPDIQQSLLDEEFSGDLTPNGPGKTIGFIRIANFETGDDLNNTPTVEAQIDGEIAFMEKGTDG